MSGRRWSHPKLLLIGADLRCTAGRLAILRVLMKADAPLTEEAIQERLGPAGRLNKVTIYRALEVFEKAGLVHRAYVRGRVRYYELADRCTKAQCHPHFTCRGCGGMFCLPEAQVEMATGVREGFKVERQQVRLEGLCRDCAEGTAKVKS